MSEQIKKAIKGARKIVIKIGSNTLAKNDGTQNTDFMASFARQVKNLIDAGKQVSVVSSGAQVSGVSALKEWARKKDVHYRQALCAIGQVELMSQWRKAFAECDIHIGQLLFVKENFENKLQTLNIRNTLFTLVDEGVVPIINENDSVSFEEDSIGDNDNLSALTSILWGADLLILFSDIDGVYSDNPKTNPDAKLIQSVNNIDELRKQITIGETNAFRTGENETKQQPAQKCFDYNSPVILANGARPQILDKLSDGTGDGTIFLPEE
ncbi:MAG: glutamate 5-kinase [Treponema sp.]|nr:glutamate 5-kinase [Treponema sp.]